MPFYDASDQSADVVAAVVRLEPHFASEASILRRLFEAAAVGSHPELPETFLALRKNTTRRRWRVIPPDQNERASRQAAIMRRVGNRGSSVRLLQQIFADDLSNMTFPDDFDISGMNFACDVLMVGCSIEGALRLGDARFLASCDFSETSVRLDLTGEQTEFAGPATFSRMSVGRAARFGFSEFSSDLTLDGAMITRELWLRNSRVAGALSARDVKIGRDASLGNCVYGGPVTLDGSRFRDTVSFEGARFERILSLDRCAFAGRLRLQDVELVGGISVRGARFEGEVIPPLHEIVAAPSPQHELIDRLRGCHVP